MKRLLRKDFVILSLFFLAMAMFCGLLSGLIGFSWIRVVIGFMLMYFPILMIWRMTQKRKHKQEAEWKSLKSHNSSTHTTQPNVVGKALVAQQRREFFFLLKMCGIGTLFGGLAGLTISGFWSGILNRCSACGRYDAEKAHRRFGPNDTVYYNCPGTQVKQFSVPKPQRNTFVSPLDDR